MGRPITVRHTGSEGDLCDSLRRLRKRGVSSSVCSAPPACIGRAYAPRCDPAAHITEPVLRHTSLGECPGNWLDATVCRYRFPLRNTPCRARGSHSGAPIRCRDLGPGREAACFERFKPQDISIFFEHQDDPVASAMAAFPSRDRAAHDVHWAKILADGSVIARTIVEDGQVVGNIGSWVADGERGVGYWIGRPYWGRGYATRALAELITEVPERPVHAPSRRAQRRQHPRARQVRLLDRGRRAA
jgi:RimJ/RimL family protein N-acetyltransferase